MKLESKRAELNREKTTRSVLAQFPFGRVEFKRCLKLAEAIFVFWINKALESVAEREGGVVIYFADGSTASGLGRTPLRECEP